MHYTPPHNFVVYYLLRFLPSELRPVSGPLSCRTCWSFFPIVHSSVAARSKPWVCGRSLSGIAGSNPTDDRDVCLLWVLCCHVQVSASGWSLVQSSPTECGVSECDREALIPWPTGGYYAIKNNRLFHPNIFSDILKSLKNVAASCIGWTHRQ